MLSFSGSLKIFVAVEPCDMRRSFNGLHDAVTTKLSEDPRSGSIFAFTNKRRTLLKILYWDPRDYLEDVLTRLPAMKASEAASLIPGNWLKARSGKAQRQAA